MSEPDILRSSHSIPGLAYTKTFHIINTHVSYHLRWRNSNDAYRFLIDTRSRHPITQPYIMGASWESHSKCYFFMSLNIFNCSSGFIYFSKTYESAKIFGKCDRLPVVI